MAKYATARLSANVEIDDKPIGWELLAVGPLNAGVYVVIPAVRNEANEGQTSWRLRDRDGKDIKDLSDANGGDGQICQVVGGDKAATQTDHGHCPASGFLVRVPAGGMIRLCLEAKDESESVTAAETALTAFRIAK